MADCFDKTNAPGMEEANERLTAFQHGVKELADKYGVHGFMYAAGIASNEVMPGLQTPEGTVVAGGGYEGCMKHTLTCLAGLIGDRMSGPDIAGFLGILNAICAARSQREGVEAFKNAAGMMPTPEEEPAKPTETDLLNMPLPSWAQKKVQ